MYVCVRACVCVRERECVCVCARTRELDQLIINIFNWHTSLKTQADGLNKMCMNSF